MADDNQVKTLLNKVGSGDKPIPTFNNIELVYRLISPQTLGYDHINLDMSFTNLDAWAKIKCTNLNKIINTTKLYGLKKCVYLGWGELAGELILDRSLNGWSGKILTTTITENKTKIENNPDRPKTGFWSGFMNKKAEATNG